MSNEFKRSPSGLQVLKHMIIAVPLFSAASGTSSLAVNVPLGVLAPNQGACKPAPFTNMLLPVGVALTSAIITSANTINLTFSNRTAGALNVPANTWIFTTLHNPSLEGV